MSGMIEAAICANIDTLSKFIAGHGASTPSETITVAADATAVSVGKQLSQMKIVDIACAHGILEKLNSSALPETAKDAITAHVNRRLTESLLGHAPSIAAAVPSGSPSGSPLARSQGKQTIENPIFVLEYR